MEYCCVCMKMLLMRRNEKTEVEERDMMLWGYQENGVGIVERKSHCSYTIFVCVFICRWSKSLSLVMMLANVRHTPRVEGVYKKSGPRTVRAAGAAGGSAGAGAVTLHFDG